MLAKTFGDGPSCQYIPGMLVQPKLNGIRALYWNGEFVSRDGEVWSQNCLQHLRHALTPFQNVVLDGELYVHGQHLQSINSRIAVVRLSPHEEESMVEYHIFDYISTEPCLARMARLTTALSGTASCIQRVQTFVSASNLEANSHYKAFKLSGYEGMMYRDSSAPYAIPNLTCKRKDNRTHWLLKRKDWLDLDCLIVGMGEGAGKHADTMSYFVLRWGDVEFEVSSGPTDAERRLYYQLGPALKGQRCKIEYREITPDGKPFHCRIVQVELPRQYEDIIV